MSNTTNTTNTNKYPNGYTIIDNRIFTNDELDIYEKSVLMTLNYHAMATDKCYPSRKLLAKESGMSIRKLDGVLKSLVEGGWITVTRIKNGDGWANNVYKLNGYVEETDCNDPIIIESVAEMSEQEKLVKKLNLNAPLTEEQISVINKWNMTILDEVIQNIDKVKNGTPVGFKYIHKSYINAETKSKTPVAPKAPVKKQPKKTTGWASHYGEQHHERYDENELESKLLAVQNKKSKSTYYAPQGNVEGQMNVSDYNLTVEKPVYKYNESIVRQLANEAKIKGIENIYEIYQPDVKLYMEYHGL